MVSFIATSLVASSPPAICIDHLQEQVYRPDLPSIFPGHRSLFFRLSNEEDSRPHSRESPCMQVS
jgi:hypothetical protein